MMCTGVVVEARAKLKKVEITSERVIYQLLESAADWLTAAAPRVAREVVVGQANVLAVRTSSSRKLLLVCDEQAGVLRVP
jgi:translation initiation factor IF-2